MLKKYFLITLILCLISAFIYKRVTAEGQSYKGKAKANASGTGDDRDFSGESLYTGDVAFSAPITEIGGIAVAVTYNSNVHKLVRADNAVLQAGWAGLGWTLNLGSITADINNTRDVSDDRYFYVDANGGSELILQSGNSFRLKDYQYWLITRHLDANGNLIGWTIIREYGIIYRYGNYDKTTGNFNLNLNGTYATRVSLGWGNLVTNPLATFLSSGTWVAYQWDLSDIQDIAGKHTTIEYQQEEDFLSILSYQSSHYTRASYPYRIIDHTGRSVQFVLAPLPAANNEYPVPPDQKIQRYFQSKFLDEILVKNNVGAVTQKCDLDYAIADILSLGRNKRYLTKIQVKDASGNKSLPATLFEYYSVNGVPSGDNRGALKRIVYPDGGEVSYDYTYQTLNNVVLNFEQQYTSNLYPVTVTTDIANSGLSGHDFYAVKVTNGTTNFLKVYRWGTKGWYEDNSFPISSGIADYWVSNDYIVVKENSTTMKVAKRKLDGWEVFNVNVTAGNSLKVAGLGNDFFMVKHNRISTGSPTFQLSEDVSIVRWNNNNWIINYIDKFDLGSPGNEDNITAACGSRFFVMRSEFRKNLNAFVWNGTAWDPKLSQTFSYEIDLFAGKDYFITYNHTTPPKSINVWRWNGTDWGNGLSYYIDPSQGITAGDNFFVLQGAYQQISNRALIMAWKGEPASNDAWSIKLFWVFPIMGFSIAK